MKSIKNKQSNTSKFKGSSELLIWLTNRFFTYITWLTQSARKEDIDIWCEKYIRTLKFLGDYKLEEDLKNFNN